MGSLNIHFTDDEDKKLEQFKKKWNISKYNVVKQMVREFAYQNSTEQATGEEKDDE